MSFTLTQSLGYQTKQSLQTAYAEGDSFNTHIAGRFRLLGTAVVGTVEIIARLACFLLGHIAGIFSLYQSADINQFLKEQIQAGFSASTITSASFFALLSPDIFRNIHFPQEALEAPEPIPVPRSINRETVAEELRVLALVVDVVRLPFQMVAFFFKLPFYFVYLTFQMAFVLPIRLMLLPLQIFINALNFERLRNPFDLNLI